MELGLPFHNWPEDRCMFCDAELSDQSVGFIEHIEESTKCCSLWEIWMRHLKDDWIGD